MDDWYSEATGLILEVLGSSIDHYQLILAIMNALANEKAHWHVAININDHYMMVHSSVIVLADYPKRLKSLAELCAYVNHK